MSKNLVVEPIAMGLALLYEISSPAHNLTCQLVKGITQLIMLLNPHLGIPNVWTPLRTLIPVSLTKVPDPSVKNSEQVMTAQDPKENATGCGDKDTLQIEVKNLG